MIDVTGVLHIGIRVADLERALAFYRHLGFGVDHVATDGVVAILTNRRGVELNLIVNADDANDGRNILMDVDAKYPGYTHMALEVPSYADAIAHFEANGFAISGGPVNLGQGVSIFVRDPDRNVIELRQKVARLAHDEAG